VKEPIVVPFYLLFAFLCAAVLFSALDIFSHWGLSAGADRLNLSFILQRFPESALQSMIPAAVTAMILAGFRMASKPFSRFLALLICLATSYLLLVNGMIWINRLARSSHPAASAGVTGPLQPRVFTRVADTLIDPQTVTETGLKGVLLYAEANPPDRRLSVYSDAQVSVSGGTLTVRFPAVKNSKPMELTEEIGPAPDSVLAPDRFTAFFLRDINGLTADLKKLLENSLGEFFTASFSLLFLCAASLALLRITRWPLLNILLLMMAVRGYFLLYHVLAVGLGPEVGKVITDPMVARLFPSAALAIVGVLFLLADILFIPADRLKQVEAL
jgi:hypothetical protein